MQLTIEIEVQDCDGSDINVTNQCENLTLEIIDAPVSDSVAIDDNAGAGDTDVTWSADKSAKELTDKVDKVEGYSLVADDEIDKLSTVEQYAQKNLVSSVAGKQGDVLLDKSDVGLSAVDNTADADKPVSTAVADALADKVGKEAGKQLSDENYTLAEKDKLGGIAEQATKNRDDVLNADKLHEHVIADVAGLDAALLTKFDKADIAQVAGSATDKVMSQKAVTGALGNKVDKELGYSLIPDTEITRLATMEAGATKNRADAQNADKVHAHTTAQVSGLDSALETKVDKVTGKGLSDANFTQDEKDKLSALESSKFVGLFVGESALPSTGSEGDYANVDGGVGSDVYRVIWDSNDNKWVRVQGVSTDLTPAQIKQQYESNPDTNAFTDAERAKLSSVATGASANRADSENADKLHSHAISDVTGLTTRLNDIDSLIGDVESVLVAINGEP